jgi:hypothetical protein
MQLDILQCDCIRSDYIPSLIDRNEATSKFFIYFYAGCRAKQYRTESRKAADSANKIKIQYKLS